MEFKCKICGEIKAKKEFPIDNLQLLPRLINTKKSDKWDGTEENKSFNLKYVTLAELQENLNKF